jgi:membrane-bound serine protease (ClpP class)
MLFKPNHWRYGAVVLATILTLLPFQAAARELLTLNIRDAIGPAVAEQVADALNQASDSEAAGIVILLDTPGGNAESMRRIVQSIYACNVPVIVFVSPSGARAASAGVMITMAGDIAAMAPGTNIGAASPVGGGGQEIGKTMATKVTNDMVAFSKGIAKRRGRNAEWIEKAVRESVSVTAAEALELNIIDLVAEDLEDLIKQIDGREVADKGRLDLTGVTVRQVAESTRTRILKLISNPNIAYILFMIGLAGLYFELSHPGAIFPGVVGAICLILAFFSFHSLPVNVSGILLILLAAVLFILEIKVTSYGMLSVAGLICMILGSLMLFKGAGPEYQVAWQVFMPTVLLISAFFVVVTTLVVRAHVHTPYTGAEGMVGEIGTVKEYHAGSGKVLVHGELWKATFRDEVVPGDRVEVIAVRDLVVTVGTVGKPSSQGSA